MSLGRSIPRFTNLQEVKKNFPRRLVGTNLYNTLFATRHFLDKKGQQALESQRKKKGWGGGKHALSSFDHPIPRWEDLLISTIIDMGMRRLTQLVHLKNAANGRALYSLE